MTLCARSRPMRTSHKRHQLKYQEPRRVDSRSSYTMARLAHAVKICLLLFVASAAYSGWQREQPGAADGDASPSPPTLRAGRKRLLSGLFSGGASHDEEAPARVLDAAEVVVAGVSVGAVDNTTCDYVHDLTTMEEKCNFVSQANNPCPDAVNLVNYLTLFYCSSTTAHTFVVLFLILVLLMFVSLLATTADYFFVPPVSSVAGAGRCDASLTRALRRAPLAAQPRKQATDVPLTHAGVVCPGRPPCAQFHRPTDPTCVASSSI